MEGTNRSSILQDLSGRPDDCENHTLANSLCIGMYRVDLFRKLMCVNRIVNKRDISHQELVTPRIFLNLLTKFTFT